MDWTPFLVSFAVFLFSLSVHECAHAWTARRLGDDTGYLLGRITLNPIPHIDPIGTLLLPGLFLWQSGGAGIAFGWAKPVPYQPFRMRDPFLGSAAVAAAGPVSNLLLALAATFVLGLASPGGVLAGSLGHDVMRQLITLNVVLALFNLLPVPPLDGSTIVGGLLPRRASMAWGRLEALGPALFILLLVTGTAARVLYPAVDAVTGKLFALARGLRG